MKFGNREAVDVVFKARSNISIGTTKFEAGEPVLYFDTLTTSTMESNSATVYAQGGKGNPRLVAWEGEKQITFTFEDALISKEGLAILAGAGLYQIGDGNTEQILVHQKLTGVLNGDSVDVDYGQVANLGINNSSINQNYAMYVFGLDDDSNIVSRGKATTVTPGAAATESCAATPYKFAIEAKAKSSKATSYLVDCYMTATANVSEISIEPDKFAGYFYVEGDTLFRAQSGEDYPAQLVIPKVKIQTAMNITMSGSGDPSTFTFTGDAFPAVVNGGIAGKKVLSVIHIIEDPVGNDVEATTRTNQGVSFRQA